MQRFLDLAAKYEDFPTPFLLMDRQALCEKASEFLAHAKHCRVFYAAKANSDIAVLEALGQCGMGFEVSTEGELNLLRSLGVQPDRIITGNPVKAPSFIQAMHRFGSKQFSVDSAGDIDKLRRFAPDAEVMVRLTVDNSLSAWPLAEKFGVGVQSAVELLARASESNLNPAGVTFHVGSQCTNTRGWQDALERARAVWMGAEERGISLRTLNIGGGFPAHHSDEIPSIQEIFDCVHEYVASQFPENVQLQAEPGRALVGDAGILVSTVIGKTQRRNEDWLTLDVGVFNGMMESTGGIAYRYIPVASHGPDKKWIVSGPSCDSVDVMTKEAFLPEPAEDERVLIFPAGAYTTVYASRFNGLPIPQTVLA